jgi:hypothetical protein
MESFDPMNGQINDPACENYDAARLRFQEFDHCLGDWCC